MQTHPHLKTWIAILIAFLLFSFIPYKILIVTYAQAEAPFLVSPFYGRKNVNSWFDHELPNYGTTGSILRYDGIRRTNTDKTTCLTDNIDYNCYDGHNGLDFDLNYEPVLAAGDGYVTFAGWETGYEHYREYGLHINIRHEVYGDYYLTNYGHLSSVAVKQGEYVKAGQVIGTSGSNGASSGRHLHFDVSLLKNGEYLPVDPFGWQPVSNADVQDDPWENYAVNGNYGARSWCMWKAGQFASYCNPNANDQPLNELRALSKEIIDDGEVTFSKGYGGFNLNQCVGVDPLCRNWYESNAGVGNHTFRTFADGLQGVYETVDNWARWERTTFSEGTYDIYITVPDVVI